jgi:putative nucleotidyltransferase with HDIG domain
MEERIEAALKGLISSFQVAKIYTTTHPKFKDSIDKAYLALREILSAGELVVGIVGGELVSGKEVFFDLSRKVKGFIANLEARSIERVAFRREVTKEELVKFISFLINPIEIGEKNIQDYLALEGIRNIIIGKLKGASAPISSQDDIIKSVDYLKRYEASLGNISQPIDAVLNREKINHLELRVNMAEMMENLMGRYEGFLKLGIVKRYDVMTFVHLLNVSILAMHFASRCGFDREDVLDIGIAALFHDIGKLYISRKIIKKAGKLTDAEYEKISSHTNIGAEILLNYIDTLGVLPPVVAFEHHLRYDLKGYPNLRFSQSPHIASLITSICDVYDALIQRRTYKRDYPPDMVYNMMMREKGSYFDPYLLDKFFKIVGVWPRGTIVVLNDKRICVVREENEDDIFSPVVEVISPGSNRVIIDLKKVKEKVKIDHFLNPLGEGKKYLNLI